MKTAIFYFSGTGNNLYVGRKIAEGLGGAKVYPFKEILKGEITIQTFDRILFCVPSYYSHVPNFVQKIIQTIEFERTQKIYSIVVCGGNRGHAIEDLRDVISKSNGCVCGEYMVMLPGNYILSYGGLPRIVVQVERFFADKKIKRIVKAIVHNNARMLNRPGLFYRKSDEPRLKKAISEFATIGAHFTVSNECVGCGTCVNVCPVNNIAMSNRKPTFGQECQQCMACIQWCPARAIDYEGKASARKRYHHPEITVKDIRKEKL
ncbi:MAG: EFR1 family ferrodoxin [Clostridiales bacterium]|nr:EFR1 family ferrodoxin [Clostridiales bacterium]